MNAHPASTEMGWGRGNAPFPSAPSPKTTRSFTQNSGHLTLAFVLIIGDADRFHCGKQVASYLGLVPLEDSSGNTTILSRRQLPGFH